MGNKIAIVGAGAVGGYAGAHMAQAGEDVTFIDPWPEHVEQMQQARPAHHPRHERAGVHGPGARAACDRGAAARQGEADRHRLRLHEVLRHRLGDDDDQAVSGARRLRRLAAELHERGDDRRRRRLGQDAGLHRQLDHRRPAASPAMSIAAPASSGAAHTVFRVGEVHGRVTDRAPRRSAGSSASPTAPWSPTTCGASAGRSWSPTSWATGSRPAPACPAGQMLQNDAIRHFSTRLGSEAIRVGQALGYELEEILHLPPETIARAGEGDAAATRRLRRAPACQDAKQGGGRAAPVDGPGHGQGPPHRDRVPQRLCRAQEGRGGRHRHAGQRRC